jgi:hypothetical protein
MAFDCEVRLVLILLDLLRAYMDEMENVFFLLQTRYYDLALVQGFPPSTRDCIAISVLRIPIFRLLLPDRSRPSVVISGA